MAKDLIRYDLLVQDALKGVVRKVLTDAARDGIAGEHHFYVSFRTDLPGVRLSNRLREKHPRDMTIVLQHQFWDLGVTEHSFEVGLSFAGIPERLLVSFDALTGFFDPSVQFGLKFEVQGEGEAQNDQEPAEASPGAGSEPMITEPKRPRVPALAKPSVIRKADPSGPEKEAADKGKPEPASPAAAGSGEVVSLDAFRKKT